MALNTAQQLGAALNASLPLLPAFVYGQGVFGQAEQFITLKVYPVGVTEAAADTDLVIRRVAPWVQKNHRVRRRRMRP